MTTDRNGPPMSRAITAAAFILAALCIAVTVASLPKTTCVGNTNDH